MRKSKIIYLDSAASVSANPSSVHALGREAQKKLQTARSGVAEILRARPEEIIFTSGGTESNNLALQGAVFSWRGKNPGKILPHIITTNIEHPSVLQTCKILQKRKLAQVSIVPVEKNGIVDPKKIKKALKTNTILVSVMYANNEIGTIQPIREIAKEIRHHKKMRSINFSQVLGSPGPRPRPDHSKNLPTSFSFPVFHTDAVQAANELDLNVEKLGVDMLSLSGAKIEGAGRAGVLYKKKSVPLAPVFGGGDQEMGLRPGTENLPEILKFFAALKSAQKIKEKEAKRLMKLRDYFITKLFSLYQTSDVGNSDVGRPTSGKKFDKATLFINGDLKNRLPNNVNITFPKIPSDLLVIELSARGIMASSKSACKSGGNGSSHVIKAIHPEINSEIGGVRFSLSRQTTRRDIDYTVDALTAILTKLEKWYN